MNGSKLLGALLIGLCCCPAARADDYDDAKRLAEDFINQYEQVRSLKKPEVTLLVKTICDAEFEDLDSVSRNISSRVKDDVNDKYDKLESLRNQAIGALDKILSNDAFKEKQSEAADYKKRVGELWDRIVRMYSGGIRGGNNPVVAYMRQLGQDAHPEYQSPSEYCTENEVPTAEGPADCLYASKCWVVELKPNNDRAVNRGRVQAREYAVSLNKDEDGKFSDLVGRKPDFKKCSGKLEARVATYTACPEVDDEGNFKSTSYGWSDPLE